MKKNLIYLSLIIAFNLVAVNFAWAESSTTTPQESLQESVTNLINTKDQDNLTPEQKEKDEQNLRLEIFGKVLDLSIKEVEDIIEQLKVLKNLNEPETNLRNQLLEKFNGFLQFYDEQKKNLNQPEEFDLTAIKKLAQDFKDWRENIYRPIFETATDFLLINQQEAVLEMTEKRYQKISLDINKLKKTNLEGIDILEKSLDQAANLIKTAKDLWQETEDNFWQILDFTALATASSTPTATSSGETVTLTATSTITPTSTSVTAEDQSLSIKNLIGESLNKIKEAYRIFIEMSIFVKKLLI